jgi:hypothetical protein
MDVWGISKLQALIKKENTFFPAVFFPPVFCHQNSGSGLNPDPHHSTGKKWQERQ